MKSMAWLKATYEKLKADTIIHSITIVSIFVAIFISRISVVTELIVYLLLPVFAVVSFYLILLRVSRESTVKKSSLFLLFVFFFTIIFCFAKIYGIIGGIYNDTGPVETDFSTCLYFSVVTFTTLGYGDLHPMNETRGIAAFEALLGYMCMGILIGVVVFLITKKEDEERQKEDEERQKENVKTMLKWIKGYKHKMEEIEWRSML